MAKKMYFQISPDKFSMYSRITREGEIKFIKSKQFDMEDSFYNKLIFVAKKKKLKGRITVKEQITGKKFIIKVIPRPEKPAEVKIYSNKLELRSRGEITLQDIVMTNEQAAGFFYSFRPLLDENEETNEHEIASAKGRKREYVRNVLDFFEEAKYRSKLYKNDLLFQDKVIQRSLKQMSKRLR